MYSTFLTSKSKSSFAALALAAAAFAVPMSASAARCKDVQIEVVNQTGGPIEVYDVDYFDWTPGRWRSEAVRDRVVGHGQSWIFDRNLEGVGGERTQIKIEYRMPRNGRFRGRFDAMSGDGPCYRGSTYRVVVR